MAQIYWWMLVVAEWWFHTDLLVGIPMNHDIYSTYTIYIYIYMSLSLYIYVYIMRFEKHKTNHTGDILMAYVHLLASKMFNFNHRNEMMIPNDAHGGNQQPD